MGGLVWGKMGHVRGIVQYGVSPWYLSPFKGVFMKKVSGGSRKMKYILENMVIPFSFFYWLSSYADHKSHELHRKNPADYVNDN